MISPSQRPVPDNTKHSQQADIHALGGIRTHSLSRRAVAYLRLRPRCHWDRLIGYYSIYFGEILRQLVLIFHKIHQESTEVDVTNRRYRDVPIKSLKYCKSCVSTSFLILVKLQELLLALKEGFLFLLSSENTLSIIQFGRESKLAGQLQVTYFGLLLSYLLHGAESFLRS